MGLGSCCCVVPALGWFLLPGVPEWGSAAVCTLHVLQSNFLGGAMGAERNLPCVPPLPVCGRKWPLLVTVPQASWVVKFMPPLVGQNWAPVQPGVGAEGYCRDLSQVSGDLVLQVSPCTWFVESRGGSLRNSVPLWGAGNAKLNHKSHLKVPRVKGNKSLLSKKERKQETS